MSNHPEISLTNSLGMRFVRIQPGTFNMGASEDDSGAEFDERPAREVRITHAFDMAVTEVTNAQYEAFDPAHYALRGKRGISSADDEAAVYVSWHDARRFCQWLSAREGRFYRLPTEAEWEYACRAATKTAYWTGEELPEEHQRHQTDRDWTEKPLPVDLTVGQAPANPWGLREMHGGVEEWCADWYAPYPEGPASDPRGPAHGDFRVTRGGSHNTGARYLRSSNRLAAPPEDRSWQIGFRVVVGPEPESSFSPPPEPATWAKDVSQEPFDWGSAAPNAKTPVFAPPIPFVHIPEGSNGPLYSQHNHCPSITWFPNGDLLAIWFSTIGEAGREMVIAGSRLRRGAVAWEAADVFHKAADRNMTGSALLNDGAGSIHHLNGIEAGAGWANLALAHRVSRDNGATWSPTRLVDAEHDRRNQVISGAFQTADGRLIVACDAAWSGEGGSAIHISMDKGLTWVDPGAGTPKPEYREGASGGTIAGIHAGVVELEDGRLMAFGRGDSIDGRMPCSISGDAGRTWTYGPSPWPPISGGQRLVLMRLREGPILFVSFTDASSRGEDELQGMVFTDAAGREFTGYGLFAALSYDEGKTWPVRKLLTPGEGEYSGGAWTNVFQTSATRAEPRGYMAATQSPDRMIHIISSGVHYRMNLAWLETPAAPVRDAE